MKEQFCPLCNSKTNHLLTFRKKEYHKCNNCDAVFMLPDFFVSLETEKSRYELHNDGSNDLGYLNFIKPITDYVINNFDKQDNGLDFGAGHSVVIANVLNEVSLNVKIYDPFFHNNKELLKEKYDYIIACEVIEHFHYPLKEFTLLYSLLNPHGKLIIMTDPLKETTNFSKWYYKNDETHVFFYSQKTFQFIQKTLDFKELNINDRLIVFEK